jgi:hypothetical protein
MMTESIRHGSDGTPSRKASDGSLAHALLLFAALCLATTAPAEAAGNFAPGSASLVQGDRAGNAAALDPFLAGALGLIPFASGLYISEKPARGIMFTAIDALMALGVYTSRYTIAGDPENARNYFLLMGANNLLDAYISVRYANAARGSAMILPGPDGGVQGAFYWRF